MNDQMLKAFYVPRRIRTFVEWLTATYTNRYTIGTFHTPYMVQYFFSFFCPRRESNSRPPVYKTGALPLSYEGFFVTSSLKW